MPYRLRITTAEGKRCAVQTEFVSLDAAMTTARIALRHGAIDACIEDDDGKIVADAGAITAHAPSMANKHPRASP